MDNFLRNLAILVVLAIIVYLVSPDMMRQVFALFNGLGILPLFLLMVLLAALPTRRSRRRR